MLNVDALISQNAATVEALSESACHAKEEISAVSDCASSLTTTVDSVSHEAEASLEAIGAKLAEAEHNIESELQTARDNMSGLQSKATELEHRAEQMVSQVKSYLGEVKSKIESEVAEIESEAEATINNLQNLFHQVEEFETEVESKLKTAKSSIEGFNDVIDTVKNSINERQAALIEHFDAFEDSVRDKLQALMGDFDTLIAEGNSKLEEVETALETASNEAFTNINRKFIEQALVELSSSAGDLNKALATLGEAGEASHKVMGGEVGQVLDKLHNVTQLIESIKPVIDLVKTML